MQTTSVPNNRPAGITALSVFFAFGASISLASAASLLDPGGLLEPMWQLNPRARDAFAAMGPAAIALMAAVCSACSAAAIGLWRGRAWGRRVAIGVLSVNLLGDLANAVAGSEPRAAIAIPIVLLLLVFLFTKRVRGFFHPP